MKKKKSLITKSITRLILLGVVILVSISVVTGLQFYSIMESEYKESGNSFIQVLSSEIDANYVKELIIKEFNPKEVRVEYLGPIIGVSVGPGTIGVYAKGKKVEVVGG